jgi:DNA-binding NtrC family response regulator
MVQHSPLGVALGRERMFFNLEQAVAKHQAASVREAYSWPGNVRELQNIIERSVIVCDSKVFSIDESWLFATDAVAS